MRRFPALYSRRLTQRSKNFSDGFVEIDNTGGPRGGSFRVTIVSESGSVVERAHMHVQPPIDGGDFIVNGVLVQIIDDAECEEMKSVSAVINSGKREAEETKPCFRPLVANRPLVVQGRREDGSHRVLAPPPKGRHEVRTVDEIIELFSTAGGEKKHDNERIFANLAAFAT